MLTCSSYNIIIVLLTLAANATTADAVIKALK